MRNILFLIFFTILINNLSHAITTVNLEFGEAHNTLNQAQIDGESGTKFNLRPALNSVTYNRLSLIHKFKSASGVRFLYAPLRFNGDKVFQNDISFNGVNFPQGIKTQVEYQFNSYRGTYFRELVSSRNLLLRIGGTLKIRDALIELEQEDRIKAKKNTGVVPLLYLYSKYKLENNILFTLDFDGLMAPQGRAFDVAFSLGYFFAPSFQLDFGYRMLEGGVDNDKVYNFSQINYYFTAMQFNF